MARREAEGSQSFDFLLTQPTHPTRPIPRRFPCFVVDMDACMSIGVLLGILWGYPAAYGFAASLSFVDLLRLTL